MNDAARVTTVGTLLEVLGSRGRSIGVTDDGRPITEAFVWSAEDPLSDDPRVAVVGPVNGNSERMQRFFASVAAQSGARVSRTLIVGPQDDDLVPASIRARHVIVQLVEPANAAEVAVLVADAVSTLEEKASRRLTAAQRSLSAAFVDAEPMDSLLARLKRVVNATVAVIDVHGRSVSNTDPLPLSTIYAQIAPVAADVQRIDSEGWRGIAIRVIDPAQSGEQYGWLVATSRRPDFPDSYAASVAHIAASFVEAMLKMAKASRHQDQAIRSAVLEEALSLRREPHDPELEGRVAALGISFEADLRAVLIRPHNPRTSQRQNTNGVHEGLLRKVLQAAGIPCLLTTRDDGVVALVQCSGPTLRRLIAAEGGRLATALVGIGRPITAIGQVADSYRDALLAVRTLTTEQRDVRIKAYEEFDYATRLFADVGLDRMGAWAGDFLAPIRDREALLEGLRAYFTHGQNINAAADSLGIHHNSVRYRLARVEEVLNINLRDPASLSSMFLALTALDLAPVPEPQRPIARKQRASTKKDVDAPDMPTRLTQPPRASGGVVHGPDL